MALLVAGLAANNVWKWVPVAAQAHTWNASGAIYQCAMLTFIGLLARDWVVWLVVGVLVGFCLQTAGCSIAWLIRPWPVRPGDELCSSALHLPLGAIGLWVALYVGLVIHGRQR